MKIKLTVQDRIAIQGSLQEKDSFENLCLRHEILEKTSFSSDEIENNKIKTIQDGDNSRLTWIETEMKDYEFNDTEIKYISSNLKRLSEAKELTTLHYLLYKKFVI